MTSPIVILTTLESGFGTLLTGTVLCILLSRGRKAYHYLFAAFLLICFIWDLGTFLLMLRKEHIQELPVIGKAAIYPCTLIPALIFHFVYLFTRQPVKWVVISIWVLTGLNWIFILAGFFYQIEGHYSYEWGNIFRIVPTIFDPLIFVFWFGINLPAIWILYKTRKRTTTLLERRHYAYLICGFLVVTFSIVKALVTIGIDVPFLLPLGMLLNDILVSIIGFAIIKDRLFDITIIIKKGSLYTILAGLLIFIYSFVEHLLVTFVGEKLGEESTLLHMISIAVGIAILMPVKSRIEKGVEKAFLHRKLEF